MSKKLELRFYVTMNEGNVVGMPEDRGATIEQQKKKRRQTMSQNITPRQAESKLKNRQRNYNCSGSITEQFALLWPVLGLITCLSLCK